MPNIDKSNYTRRPYYFFNSHLETIIPSLFFKFDEVRYQRERVELSDGDFLDIDWSKTTLPTKVLIVISHGLEGNSDRHYIKRAVQFFNSNGCDVAAWNCRGCSGEPNRLARFYHHGDTDDLATVIEHCLKKAVYTKVILVGYSMGGSLSLKYLGEGRNLPNEIVGTVTFSVPCHLKDSADQLENFDNGIYRKKFLEKLKRKVHKKSEKYPGLIDTSVLQKIQRFDEFHEAYTVPLHGFKSISDFYNQASCHTYISDISHPSLIVNATNDPMLGAKCYPFEQAKSSKYVFLETPKYGGHVGFSKLYTQDSYMEERSWQFIKNQLLG